jgi:DNA replication protein DnaC
MTNIIQDGKKHEYVNQIISDEICDICGQKIKVNKVNFLGIDRMFPQMCECRKKEIREREEWNALRQKNDKLKRLFQQSRLGTKFQNSNFKSLTITNYNKEVIESLKNFVANFDKSKSYLLTSHPGTGKSTLMACVVNELIKKNRSAVFVEVPTLLNQIIETYRNGSNFTEMQIMHGLSDCDLLAIDDLGAEKHKSDDDWAVEKIYMIVNNRYKNCKSTIFTTNLDSKSLRDKLGDRIYSRIVEMTKGNMFNLNNEKDWRLEA